MLIDRDKIKDNAKAKLGVPSMPRARVSKSYRPSGVQKRARTMNTIIGVSMAVAFVVGAGYMLFTIFDKGSNIAKRKIAELEAKENPQAVENIPSSADVQIIFKPAQRENNK